MPKSIVCLAAAGCSWAAVAQTPQLEPVVVSVERSRQSAFDAPAAISALTRDAIADAGPQVNLSEALVRVPGVTVLNRNNYAQDLQLSIRGFGSRSTFGIRGVRLIVDGIPATMPDGQGQASNIALSSASRIEVLRGPMAQLYGNAAGGVVQVFSDVEAGAPEFSPSLALGDNGLLRAGLRFTAGDTSDAVLIDASHFRTDGWREHGSARRNLLNAKWQRTFASGTRASVVVNALDQPESLDPLGLTREAFEADPRQVAPLAIEQNARKSVAQQQIGGVLEHLLGASTTLTARLYGGRRELDNALSIPPAPQQSNLSSGGIVAFERDYMGAGVQLAHAWVLGAGRRARVVGGIEWDRMNEDRRGDVNDGGEPAGLKRDERNRVENRDGFVQGSIDLDAALTATAGVRTSRVSFRTHDLFIRPGDPAAVPPVPDNPDDSGSADYDATNPVIGLAWRASPVLNLYANAGRGFETPTFTELAYRNDGTGLNTTLRAARSRHAEIGAKWKPADGQRLDVALFAIATEDEIVVDVSQGGRSTFRNAGRTSRRGAELAWAGRYSPAWQATLAATLLRARFDDTGLRLPGTPERSAFAELVWTPAPQGFDAGVELQHIGKLYVNDANDDAAPAATVFNLRAGWRGSAGGWTLRPLLRLDNVGDRRYAGSVIVNDANRRFFEPALPRNWTAMLTASLALR